MAKSDYEDVFVEAGDPQTALDRVSETVNVTPDAENREAAFAAGLKDAAFIDYELALERHQSREDIETLQSRRARTYGTDFDAGKFMRELPNRSGGNGYAPDPANPLVTDEDGGASSTP
jgi:hypothetical protein